MDSLFVLLMGLPVPLFEDQKIMLIQEELVEEGSLCFCRTCFQIETHVPVFRLSIAAKLARVVLTISVIGMIGSPPSFKELINNRNWLWWPLSCFEEALLKPLKP